MKYAIALSVALGIIAACYPDHINRPEPDWTMTTTGGAHDAGRE
jgi:hypothetical protein